MDKSNGQEQWTKLIDKTNGKVMEKMENNGKNGKCTIL